jgi:hypothetical protein
VKTLLILASLTLATAAHALPTADEQFEDFQAEMLRQDQAQYQRQNDQRMYDLEQRQSDFERRMRYR